jgi:uncharacterized damage-inducible protein DinB
VNYDFLISTYETERLKVLSVWSMFTDDDMNTRPNPADSRGRSVREQMIHQCLSEDLWFRTFFGIDTQSAPLPGEETRLGFIKKYAEDSRQRVESLSTKQPAWWEQEVEFFKTLRSRAWVMVRRIAHTAHHRGQQTAMLRMVNREIHSTYGPSADTGGLPKNSAPTIYAYSDVSSLIAGESAGGSKAPLPESANQPVTERPGQGSKM